MKTNETLLMLRQNLIKKYKQYETIILVFLKFIILLSGLMMIVSSIGEVGFLHKIEVILFFAILGTFLPDKWILLGVVLLVPMYMASVNLALGVITFLFLWTLYLLFMSLFPKESLMIIATIMSFQLGIAGILPVVAGLFGNYIYAIAIIIGTFIWFAMPHLALTIQTYTNAEKNEVLNAMKALTEDGIGSILSDQTMLCTIVVFFIVFSIVYIIRKQAIEYAPYIAIGIGLVMYLVGFVLAVVFLNINMSILKIILTTILMGCIAVIAQFFSKVLDYQRAETISFEDNDHYYYVKVIPKIALHSNSEKIQRIYNVKEHSIDD